MSPIERRGNYSGGEVRVSSDSAYKKVSRDPITGVLNPTALLAILDYTMERADRAERPTSMLFIYLPEPTRTLNGDERLFQLVARFLRKTVRGEDAIGRLGNGFLGLLADTGAEGALIAGDRVDEGLWQNLGLAIAGRWKVIITTAVPGESGRDFYIRATSAFPGLAEAYLPKERRSLFSRG
jgi:hypothetical protein